MRSNGCRDWVHRDDRDRPNVSARLAPDWLRRPETNPNSTARAASSSDRRTQTALRTLRFTHAPGRTRTSYLRFRKPLLIVMGIGIAGLRASRGASLNRLMEQVASDLAGE